MRIVRSSLNHVPNPSTLTGFSRTNGGASYCYVDGNVHNWVWCVAQSQSHPNCPNTCGNGLVTGIWTDGVSYCSCNIGGMSFWVRELANYVGSSAATPGLSCQDIQARGPTRVSGMFVAAFCHLPHLLPHKKTKKKKKKNEEREKRGERKRERERARETRHTLIFIALLQLLDQAQPGF